MLVLVGIFYRRSFPPSTQEDHMLDTMLWYVFLQPLLMTAALALVVVVTFFLLGKTVRARWGGHIAFLSLSPLHAITRYREGRVRVKLIEVKNQISILRQKNRDLRESADKSTEVSKQIRKNSELLTELYIILGDLERKLHRLRESLPPIDHS